MTPAAPTILVVEDDLDTRDLVARLLSSAGYAVRLASNGWEGLLVMDQPVDLILLDMMMPGMDGPAFLKSLRGQKHGQDVPVVVMTAMNPEEAEPQVRRYDVTAILLKGGNLYPELKAILKRTFEMPRPTARVTLPERGSMVRPFLDAYLSILGLV